MEGEFWYQMVIVSRFSQSVQTLSSQGKASYIVAIVYLCIHLNFPSECASGFGQMRMRYSLYAQAKPRLYKSSGLRSLLKTVCVFNVGLIEIIA